MFAAVPSSERWTKASLRQRARRVVGPGWFRTMRRTTPLSDHWGRERGTPIDRYYIEQFLNTHQSDIRGSVLEVMDTRYTDLFGSDVQRSDVLDVDRDNPEATLVADLGAPGRFRR